MLSTAFAQVLDQRRAYFNARVAEARARTPGFDTDAFTRLLQDGVDPLAAAMAPQHVAPVVDAAWDIALALCEHSAGQAGSHALAAEVLSGLACQTALAPLVAAEPRDALGTLVNAVLRLHAMAGARPGEWVARMGSLPVTTTAQLRAAGVIVAWRAGAAHLRQGARDAADGLPEALALAAFGAGTGDTWRQLRARLASDPWWRAPGDDNGPIARDAGAFTGLGGAFDVPPSVRPWPGGFMVQAGARYFFLIADAYGAVLHGATAGEYEAAAHCDFPQVTSLEDTTLTACCNDVAIAVTSPYTHAIRVLPLP